MKRFAYTLILSALLAMVIKAILPKGKKSIFYGPMSFLISAVLILVLFSPLLSYINSAPNEWIELDWEIASPQTLPNAQEIILEKSRKQMEEAVKSAFPETEFSIKLEADGNQIPTGIRVFCADEEKGVKIAVFLQKNYSILATAENEKEGDAR